MRGLVGGLAMKSKRARSAKNDYWVSIISSLERLLAKVRNTKRGSDVGDIRSDLSLLNLKCLCKLKGKILSRTLDMLV